MYQSALPAGHALVGDAHAARGACLLAVGDAEKAHAAYGAALAAVTACAGGVRDSLAAAALLADWGGRLTACNASAAAVPRFAEALALRAARLHRDHTLVQSALRALLRALEGAGRSTDADAVRREWCPAA